LGGADNGARDGIQGDGIAAGEDLFRSQEAQAGIERIAMLPEALQEVSGLLSQSLPPLVEQFAAPAQDLAWPQLAQALAKGFAGNCQVLEAQARTAGKTFLQVVQTLQAAV
jgi:hypothetical protein